MPHFRRQRAAVAILFEAVFLCLILWTLGSGVANAQIGGGPESNDYYSQLLSQQQLYLFRRQDGDLIGDGNTQTVISGISQNCASCHVEDVFVFQGTAQLFHQEFAEPEIEILPGSGGGFYVTYTDCTSNPACSRSVTHYLWDPTQQQFLPVS